MPLPWSVIGFYLGQDPQRMPDLSNSGVNTPWGTLRVRFWTWPLWAEWRTHQISLEAKSRNARIVDPTKYWSCFAQGFTEISFGHVPRHNHQLEKTRGWITSRPFSMWVQRRCRGKWGSKIHPEWFSSTCVVISSFVLGDSQRSENRDSQPPLPFPTHM